MVRLKWDGDFEVNVAELLVTSMLFAAVWFGLEYTSGQLKLETKRNGWLNESFAALDGLGGF